MGEGYWGDLIDFSEKIQFLVQQGWTFTRTYGERRLGISDSMVFQKGLETFDVYSESRLYELTDRVVLELEEKEKSS